MEKKNEKVDKTKEYHTQQISYNYINKSIQLPNNLDTNKIDVKFDKGILSVTMPFNEVKKPKAKIIQIN